MVHSKLTALILAQAPDSEEDSEALRDAVTNQGIATAVKIVAVILLILLFQGMRSRFRRRLAQMRESRTKPWEK